MVLVMVLKIPATLCSISSSEFYSIISSKLTEFLLNIIPWGLIDAFISIMHSCQSRLYLLFNKWWPWSPVQIWITTKCISKLSSQWRHNKRDGLSNHQRLDCLLNRLFRRRSKKTSKLCVTGICEGNSSVTGEFASQSASNAENVFISWGHNDSAFCGALISKTHGGLAVSSICMIMPER